MEEDLEGALSILFRHLVRADGTEDCEGDIPFGVLNRERRIRREAAVRIQNRFRERLHQRRAEVMEEDAEEPFPWLEWQQWSNELPEECHTAMFQFYFHRRHYQKRRKAAVLIQRCLRQHMQHQQAQTPPFTEHEFDWEGWQQWANEAPEEWNAALSLVVHEVVRADATEAGALVITDATTEAGRLFQLHLSRRHYQNRQRAAFRIQHNFRRHLCKRRAETMILLMRSAAVRIQHRYRGHFRTRQVSDAAQLFSLIQTMSSAAVRVQHRYPEHIRHRYRERIQHMHIDVEYVLAAVTVQRRYRTHLLKMRRLGAFLQRRLHDLFMRRHYQAIFIQRRYRERLMRRFTRSHPLFGSHRMKRTCSQCNVLFEVKLQKCPRCGQRLCCQACYRRHHNTAYACTPFW